MVSTVIAVFLVLMGTCMSQVVNPTFSLSTLVSGMSSNSVHQQQKQQQPVRGYCSANERSTAFNRCIMNFGMQHMNHFDFLARNRPVCRSEVFRCNEMQSLIDCLNSQPTTVISNRCWVMMKDVLTKTLHDYNIPCSYQDLEAKCVNKVTQLKTIGERSNKGQGQVVNPLQAIFRRIAPMITMMIYSGINGGFGGGF